MTPRAILEKLEAETLRDMVVDLEAILSKLRHEHEELLYMHINTEAPLPKHGITMRGTE